MRKKLISAYRKMMERVKVTLESVEKKTGPDLHKALEIARKTAVELDELTQEEAERIAEYVKRDLQAAALFLHDTGRALKDWLLFDWMLIEDKLWYLFSVVADKTYIDLVKFNQQFQRDTEYHSHEIISIGSLTCKHCGKLLHFQEVSEIPPCPACHHTVFVRSSR